MWLLWGQVVRSMIFAKEPIFEKQFIVFFSLFFFNVFYIFAQQSPPSFSKQQFYRK
jgi:hypothetical protein